MWCNEMAFFDLFVKADKKNPCNQSITGIQIYSLVPRAGFDKPKIGETDKIEKERYLFDI